MKKTIWNEMWKYINAHKINIIIGLIVAILAIVISILLPKILTIIKNRRLRKKFEKNNKNYNFVANKEYKIYKNVGKEKAQKKLKDDYCRTHTEWKKHFIKTYLQPQGFVGNDRIIFLSNFKRYLNAFYRANKSSSSATSYALIPLMISIVTIFYQVIDGYLSQIENFIIKTATESVSANTALNVSANAALNVSANAAFNVSANAALNNNDAVTIISNIYMRNFRIISVLVVIVIIVPIIIWQLYSDNERVDFYEDCIEVINDVEKINKSDNDVNNDKIIKESLDISSTKIEGGTNIDGNMDG